MGARRAFQMVFVATLFAILVLPLANMVAPLLPQPKLAGVVEQLSRPTLGMPALRAETFQKGFTAWFDQNYGARPLATVLDNSLDLRVFGELHFEHRVVIGHGGTLFVDEQVDYGNRQRNLTLTDAFARKAKRAQDLLEARDKFFIVILIPAKIRFFPAEVPAGRLLKRSSPRPAETNLDEVIEAFGRHGVKRIDGRPLLDGNRLESYSLHGRHLNGPAVCRLLAAALEEARPHLKATLPPIECGFELSPVVEAGLEEEDLAYLLNVWPPLPAPLYPRMLPVLERVAIADRPDTVIAGSSFIWRFFDEAERNHALGRTHLIFYNNTVFDRRNSPALPMPDRRSDTWKRYVLDKQLFLLPMIEEFIPGDNMEFLDDVIAGLETQPPPRP